MKGAPKSAHDRVRLSTKHFCYARGYCAPSRIVHQNHCPCLHRE
jgi:hypothetical protein